MKKRSKRAALKIKKGAWFIPVRWSYLPCSWQGWLTYVPFLYYLIATFLLVDSHTVAASDTIIGTVPYWVAGAAIMHWIAAHKS